jgi:hypothetical protein
MTLEFTEFTTRVIRRITIVENAKNEYCLGFGRAQTRPRTTRQRSRTEGGR